MLLKYVGLKARNGAGSLLRVTRAVHRLRLEAKGCGQGHMGAAGGCPETCRDAQQAAGLCCSCALDADRDSMLKCMCMADACWRWRL